MADSEKPREIETGMCQLVFGEKHGFETNEFKTYNQILLVVQFLSICYKYDQLEFFNLGTICMTYHFSNFQYIPLFLTMLVVLAICGYTAILKVR